MPDTVAEVFIVTVNSIHFKISKRYCLLTLRVPLGLASKRRETKLPTSLAESSNCFIGSGIDDSLTRVCES
jgi:hypothetical protein